MLIHVTLESYGMFAQIIIKHIFQHCLDTSLHNLPNISPVCRVHLMKMLQASIRLIKMFVTIEPHGIYFFYQIPHTHTFKRCLVTGDTDFQVLVYDRQYSQPCMHSMCLIFALFNARPAVVQLNRCVSPSVHPSEVT